MLIALAYLFIAGMAYGIACWISSTGLAYWRLITGFLLALIVGWFGGVLFSALVFSLFHPESTAQITFNLIGSGFWCALFGAGYGVYRGRFKLVTGKSAPALSIPKRVTMVVAVVAVIGIVAAVALPAYQDYTKRQVVAANPVPTVQTGTDWDKGVITQPTGFSQIDEFLFSQIDEFLDGKLNQDGVAARTRGDYATALRIFRFLAAQGFATAQGNLGVMYIVGEGVAQDYVRAHMWLNLSAGSGNPASMENRNRIAKSMTPQQIAQAQQMARACQQRNFSGCE